MRIPHHLIKSPSGIYHFRLKVPRVLQAAWGLRVIKQSLRTTSLPHARGQAYWLALHYAHAFASQGGRGLSKPPDIKDIIAGFHGQGRKYDVEFDPATGRPTRIKTDGSAQDNADALAMARVVFAQPLPPPLAAVVPQSPARVSMSLGEAIKIYTATEAPSLKPDTWDARQRALSSFVAFVKPETPVAEIARHTAAAWGHDLMADELTKRTAGNYVSHVAQLFKWLKGQGQITGENPVKGVVVVSKREKRLRQAEGHGIEAFELEDLKRLFDPANYKKLTMAHARWAPLIALYTGARVGEIAQLYLRDFIVEDGHPCIRIDADNDGQTVKTESSRRLVPLHPVLIELGLLDYVENLRRQKVKRLFPNIDIKNLAGAGNAISKQWSRHVERVGVVPRRENGTVSIHSLRKNVVQILQGKVESEMRRAFVGHESDNEDVHKQFYMRKWTSDELARLFPALSWGEWLNVPALKEQLFSKERKSHQRE